ncbi:glucosamine inositolphosphorylceramide transferase family protein [Cohaesibacter gelatinilyticus]|uniref:Glucosamine inositolphosphorylceramide transferase 1 N-terminal domain-containing protein n=1 Tax=Cohaesibacter gelatinilyticus TaxID=372072 RepID=A0A285PG09_9HYPH|nr:hypothetical protein [Cohaesibacter gelatinilyticus]SNZ20660.1 hypothetical protein SAMN06265368_3770 [Cohaesibacter gelatinilyticus]HAT84777.1 hypothetical protein [Hyphomicrobiales bacterium]
MKLCLHIDPSRTRAWHRTLIQRLADHNDIELCLSRAVEQPLAKAIEVYMEFETRLYIKAETAGASRLGFDRLDLPLLGNDAVDMVIDLAGDDACPESAMQIQLLFDGKTGEDAAIASLFGNNGLPQVALRDLKNDKILASALPSGELAAGVVGGLDQLYARVITLLDAFLHHPQRFAAPLQKTDSFMPGPMSLVKRAAKSVLRETVMKVYRILFHASHWRVGWRWVDDQDVWNRQDLSGEKWQILEDPGHNFYADPFPLFWKGKHYLFFEDLNQYEQKGILSVIEFDETGPTGPAQPCLIEDFHLSYPFFIEEEDELYMIPETSNNREIALYRADKFPFGWKKKHVLISDIDAADVTISRWDGKYWMFCVTRDGAGGYSDCLSLFHADHLLGPWQAHAQNPVLIDRATARPAGNMVQKNGKLWRPVQDCSLSYGAELALCEVTRLDESGFEQIVHKKLAPDAAWPGRKLHSLNRAGQLEVIDGAVLRPKWQKLRPWFDRKYSPQ